MWNLSSLAAKAQAAAAKAQEAAARIERQLDESTGFDGAAAAASGGAGAAGESSVAASATHDDFDDDDDFFADDPHVETQAFSSTQQAGGGWQQQRQQQEDAKVKEPSTPVATKLDVTADEGDDFFGDEEVPIPKPSAVEQQQQQQFNDPKTSEGDGGDEEIDFGDDGMGDDGWDEADDIPLDDDEDNTDTGPVVQQEQVVEDVQIQELSDQPEPKPIMEANEPNQDAYTTQEFEAPPEAPKNDTAPSYESSYGVSEVQSEQFDETPVGQIESPEINDAQIVSEVNDFETAAKDILPANDGYENHLDHVEPSPTAAVSESQPEPMNTIPAMDDAEKQQFLATIAGLESQLFQREDQLASKSDQITSLSLQHESEISSLRQVISETKEEAKKRVIKAKDRVEEMQTKLADAVRRADAAGGSSAGQSDLIAALRAEGEQLARKQSTMEQSVRNARLEARDLQENWQFEKGAKEKEQAKVESLEKEVKSLKEVLSSARKGETLSKKLEGELVSAKEESEKQRASNMVLDQQLKELKDENKHLKKEVSEAREGAAVELAGESNKLRKERDDMLSDLEGKLRTSERGANVREDALRHEVSELRKRWQDAVRRAEDLSMDVQHSTAPLLRQLESTERQSRSRAAAWAELETKLRSDLEEHVIQLEKLTKERHDFVASDKKSQRQLKEKEEEISSSQETIDILSSTIENLENKVEELDEESKRVKRDLTIAERKASEGASKVRSDMLQTVVDSEERYQSQIEALEEELGGERELRGILEKQLDDLVESVAAAEFAGGGGGQPSPEKEQKLRSATDQASILHDTLAGFDSDADEDEGDDNGLNQMQDRGSSFAAMEQLSLGLKGAKVELEALRKQLASSEETRESLLGELGDARQAVEKLPLFEQKVSDLTMEINLKEMEVQGLQEDIADVRFLYRAQLDVLLEEKMATPTPSSHLEENNEDTSNSFFEDTA